MKVWLHGLTLIGVLGLILACTESANTKNSSDKTINDTGGNTTSTDTLENASDITTNDLKEVGSPPEQDIVATIDGTQESTDSPPPDNVSDTTSKDTPPDSNSDTPIDTLQPCELGKQQCPTGTFCRAPGCDAGLTGSCLPIPDDCPDKLAVVCTCEGTTAQNECSAHQMGLNIQKQGPCETQPVTCMVGQKGCSDGEYCDGKCNNSGICTPLPTACDGPKLGACSCDGQTYDSKCHAAQYGKSVKYLGKCKAPSGKPCSGVKDDSCAEGQGCNVTKCDDNASGTCMNIGKICLSGKECGCDGVTYANYCERLKAKVARYHVGSCTEDGSLPKCQLEESDGCEMGLYCSGTGCSGTGTCMTKPFACVLPNPVAVCGCNEKTYKSACHAQQAGVPIKHTGKCKE